MWDELENALAWFAAAPGRWVSSAKQDMAAAAEWIWEVLQGDFADEQTTAQVVTGTVISMIPIVDQICDVRDLVANCKKINQDSDDKWAWVALILTLIGLIPTLGSFVKGCFKVLFAYGRKAFLQASKAAVDSGAQKAASVMAANGRQAVHNAGQAVADTEVWQASKSFVEAGIQKLNDYLRRPEIRAFLSANRIDNVYQFLADKLRTLSSTLTVGTLKKAFDEGYSSLKELVALIKKWSPESLGRQAQAMVDMLGGIRQQLDAKLAPALAPAQTFIDNLARRLEIEGDMVYRANTNSPNLHQFTRIEQHAELAEIRKNKPEWVDNGPLLKHEPMKAYQARDGWPDISKDAPTPLSNIIETFNTLEAKTYAPGTVLYRIIDPASYDNSVHWMTKAELDKLQSKADWRRRFAVWRSWNGNGEYVTYTVPPGKPLNGWEGRAASQVDKTQEYSLEGGAVQIALDPNDLDMAYLGTRRKTHWDYDDKTGPTAGTDLVGVPVLMNHWK